ncbi:MAG TPA: YkgJ family cysteine cluster protein [Epsilonproteobacteria bacterium]|nr:YkgJ family cysteine cluster protein [Campylobacterota bacterium]
MLKQEGYKYCFDSSKCLECGGHCCRGESGYIWVDYATIATIADFLSLEVEEFAKIYLKKVGHRYSLIEKVLSEDDVACIFFDENLNRCKIYKVRPKQCRTFPFWEQFKNSEDEVKNECPGVVSCG